MFRRLNSGGRLRSHVGRRFLFRGRSVDRALLNFLRRIEPGSHATQDCAESFGSIAPWKFGVVHAQQHGASDGQEVERVW